MALKFPIQWACPRYSQSALILQFWLKRPFLRIWVVWFFGTFINGFFDLKQIHYNTKINKMWCKIKCLTQIVIFRPPTDPPCRVYFFGRHCLIFWLISIKKKKKGVKMLRRSYWFKWAGTLKIWNMTPFLPLYNRPLIIADYEYKLQTE